jgi:hypothetical protein
MARDIISRVNKSAENNGLKAFFDKQLYLAYGALELMVGVATEGLCSSGELKQVPSRAFRDVLVT